MDGLPSPLQLAPADRKIPTDAWRGRVLQLLGAVTIHLLPLALLVSALPTKPKDLGGAFGQSVAVTVVSGAPRAAVAAAQPKPPSFANMEQRLSDHGVTVAAPPPALQTAAPTSLSDLFDTPLDAPGQVASKGSPQQTTGGDDDPFARASVSYRGDDPAKAARLRSRAQNCARGAKALRLLLIINSEGYLVARPRPLGAAGGDKAALRTISAIERCAPFADAATPGPPRSYEIEIG